MSTVGTLTRIAGTAIGRTAHVVTHPVESVSFAAGVARGTAGAVISGVRRGGPGADSPSASSTATPVTPSVTDAPATPAATGIPPTPTPDPVATEPSAASRTAAHGGPGNDRADDPLAELGEDPDVTTPVGTTGAGEGFNPDTTETDLQQPGTEPLMDPSLTKAVKAESAMLKKAADPDKG